MEFINCPNCNYEIPEMSKQCPKCGYKLEKSIRKFDVILYTLLFGFVVFIAIVVIRQNTSRPSNLSEVVYQIGVDALNVTDNYLDGDYDYETALKYLELLDNDLDHLGAGDINTTSFNLEVNIISVRTNMLLAGIDGSEEEIITARNELADALNKKKR